MSAVQTKETGKMKLVLKIALGILLSGAIIFAARAAFVIYFANEFKDRAAEVKTTYLQQAQERINAKQQKEREQQLAAQRENQRKQEQAKREMQKNTAWNNYYVEKVGCEVFKSDSHMVECVNHKMRAKREFEKLYASGELSKDLVR
jgi:Sec-independent protein translocase protein TatA